MGLIINLGLFLLSCIFLILSGALVVKSLTKVISFLHVSEFVGGFIIMASATTLPELFVGITSALEKNTELALGTVIGSNIINLTLIIGIPILLSKGIKVQSKKTVRDALYLTFISIIPLVLMLIGGELSRIDGIILLAFYFIYIRRMYLHGKIFTKEMGEKVKRWKAVSSTALFVLSAALLFFSAQYAIKYATLVSVDLALPSILIGLFLLAFGTSLPELVFGTQAVLTGHSEMVLGDIIGANIHNLTIVLGITAIIHPITSNFLLFLIAGIYMLMVTFIFATFIASGRRLDVKEGISLILLYGFFIIIQFYVTGLVF